jgi:hypothetical protein
MPNDQREFTVRLDPVDVALIASRNEIPGETAEERIQWIVSDDLRTLAETVVYDRQEIERDGGSPMTGPKPEEQKQNGRRLSVRLSEHHAQLIRVIAAHKGMTPGELAKALLLSRLNQNGSPSADAFHAFENLETAIAFYRLAIAKKIFTMELNRLMFTVSHRRYLRVVRRLGRLGLGTERFIRS